MIARRPAARVVACAAVLAALLLAAPGWAPQDDDAEALRGLERAARLLRAIEEFYVDPVDPEELVESAIRGMLWRLDPHSAYFTPRQTRQLLTEQEGEYYGIGLTIGIRDGLLTVISPMEDSPAARRGIHTGDGEPTGGRDLEISARRMRGPEGSEVTLTIEREGLSRPFEVTLRRAMISLRTVPYAFLLDDAVGYVRLVRFSRTSSREAAEAIDRLRVEGMAGLILDLRGNPGGDLEQAVAVADLFLDEGLIVYAQGATAASRVDFNAGEAGTRWRGELVVLIDRGSASGSEVVAGALQDQDRAILAGERSWGKGLVQTVFPLAHGAALALTSARYFTPSGRLIQRPYVPGSFDRYFDPELEAGDDAMQQARTSLGRIVYGGNGLAPDAVVEAPGLSPLAQEVMLRGAIFDFVTSYLAARPETGPGFRADDDVMERFRSFVGGRGIEVDPRQWLNDRDFLAARITLETVTRLAGAEEGYRAVLPRDRQVQEAIGLMRQAGELLRRKLAGGEPG